MNYPKFVAGLIKPGSDILQELTPHKCELLHMCMGLQGELGELNDTKSDKEDVKELGDCHFYLEGFRQLLSLEPFRSITSAPYSLDIYYYNEILVEMSEITDIVKKHVIYGKDNLHEINLQSIFNFLTAYEYTLEDVIQMNVDKLSERYSLGHYSNKQAMERKDVS